MNTNQTKKIYPTPSKLTNKTSQNNSPKLPCYWKTTFAVIINNSFLEPETQMTASIPMCFQELLQNKTIQKNQSVIKINQSKEYKKIKI